MQFIMRQTTKKPRGKDLRLQTLTTVVAVTQVLQLPTNQTEPFRDATYVPDFVLKLLDCWRGLEKGVQLSWVRDAGSDAVTFTMVESSNSRYLIEIGRSL